MRKIIAAFVAVILGMSCPANASMQDSLNGMFSSNVTNPGAYKSQTRSGFVGGGISIHTPIKPINLMTFDPPRISAGCGGLDMYGGSFSFVNANQFTALLRNLMNNAIGLLFQAALQNISPSMSSLLNSFQKMVQDMNALASNTCAIASATINAIDPGALGTKGTQDAAAVGTQLNNVGDEFTGLFGGGSASQAKSQNQVAEPKNPNMGNFTWKALNRSMVGDSIGVVGQAIDPSDPNGNIPKQFIMSLIGSTVVTSMAGTTAGSSTNPADSTPMPPLFHLSSLIDGARLSYYQCLATDSTGATGVVQGDADQWGPNSCVFTTNASTSPAMDFVGTKAYVKNMLYGDDTSTGSASIKTNVTDEYGNPTYTASSPGANSIYGKIISCQTSGCTFTAPEQNFLQLAGPIFNLLKDLQTDPATLESISPYIEDRLAYIVAISMGESVVRASTASWSNAKDVHMPQNVSDNIKELNHELSSLRGEMATTQDNITKARLIADNVRRFIQVPGAR